MNNQSNKGKHFTEADRAKIEFGLNKGHSIRSIAVELGRSPSSVKREIDRNRTYVENLLNPCMKGKTCNKHNVCGNVHCNFLCRTKCSGRCQRWCSDYEPMLCDRLKESPYVCNNCPQNRRSHSPCRFNQYIYFAKEADTQYREMLVCRRNGFDLTLEELTTIDDIVSPRIKMGQSPYHIVQNNSLPVSLSTLYRIIDSGDIGAGNIDLKQKVRRKPRKSDKRDAEKKRKFQESKIGHLYPDFLEYMASHDSFYVEMDSVIGKRDECPALLTLHYPLFLMQLAFYLEVHNSSHVVLTLDRIESLLGYERFCEAFPVILTDNGSEFSDVLGIERSCTSSGKQRTHLFFCEPNRSDEKGSCENNHRLIREIIPKSTSLVPYKQQDITLMMNHINSYCRKRLCGKCAYDMAMGVFPDEYFDLLGLFKIEPNDVRLKPSLLKEAYSIARK